MEKTRSMKEENGQKLFISQQGRNISFIDNMNILRFPIFTSKRRVNSHVSRRRKGKNRTNRSIIIII